MPAPRILTGPTLDYSSGGTSTEKLDRGFIVRELVLTLRGSVDIAGGGTTVARSDINPAGLWSLIKNLRLKINNNTNIVDIDGNMLQLLNYFFYNSADADSLNIVGTTAGNSVAFETTMIVPFWLVDSRKPIDTQLNASLLSNFEIQVDWNPASAVSGGTGFGVSSVQLDVGSLNTFGFDTPFNTQLLNLQSETVAGANNRYQVDLSTGDLYRSFIIGVMNADLTDDTPDVINNIKLVSGGVDYINIDADTWQAWQAKRLGIAPGIDSTGALNNFFLSTKRDINAWYFVNLSTDGLLSESLDTTGFSELKLEFDLAAAAPNLIVLPQQVVPLRA